jgi:hypothetical protein
MLVPQGSVPSLLGDHPLVLFERLANSASSDLGIFVIPVFFFYDQKTTTNQLRKTRYVKNWRQVAVDIAIVL